MTTIPSRIPRQWSQAAAPVGKKRVSHTSAHEPLFELQLERPLTSSFLDAAPANAGFSSASISPPRYFSALKKAHKDRVIPQLLEEDLEEQFVRGTLMCYTIIYGH